VNLVLIDVDGTLVGKNGVSDCAKKAILLLQEGDFYLSLATGRPPVNETLELARLLNPSGLHIFHQGAEITFADGKIAHSYPIESTKTAPLQELASSFNISLELYGEDGFVYIFNPTPEAKSHLDSLGITSDRVAEINRSERLPESIVKAEFVFNINRVGDARELLGRLRTFTPHEFKIHDSVSAATPDIRFISITSIDASKLNAAKWLLKKLGIPKERLIAIGDGLNDLELIDYAAFGIAMGNSHEEVRGSADLVVPDVEHCGLLEAAKALTARYS